jgi:hypothetical protein
MKAVRFGQSDHQPAIWSDKATDTLSPVYRLDPIIYEEGDLYRSNVEYRDYLRNKVPLRSFQQGDAYEYKYWILVQPERRV